MSRSNNLGRIAVAVSAAPHRKLQRFAGADCARCAVLRARKLCRPSTETAS